MPLPERKTKPSCSSVSFATRERANYAIEGCVSNVPQWTIWTSSFGSRMGALPACRALPIVVRWSPLGGDQTLRTPDDYSSGAAAWAVVDDARLQLSNPEYHGKCLDTCKGEEVKFHEWHLGFHNDHLRQKIDSKTARVPLISAARRLHTSSCTSLICRTSTGRLLRPRSSRHVVDGEMRANCRGSIAPQLWQDQSAPNLRSGNRRCTVGTARGRWSRISVTTCLLWRWGLN
jgi:hypothetical protein